MKLKIEITCKETIKPSSSSIPDHLPTYNLNVLDQFVLCARNMHVPIILFYDTTNPQNKTQTSFLLKNSLQETLTHFYPLAGRVKGYSYIDCNDAGATYIETRVAGNMKEILRQLKLDKLRQLLPINPYECSHRVSVPELVLIQVNHFSCGGLAIGVCASHTITDAATLGTFVKTWVTIASGNVWDVNGIITDTTSIFPPVADSETAYFSSLNERFVQGSLLGIATNRFVFDGAKIAALKTKIGSLTMPGFKPDLPTKFEALSALILGVLMYITDEKRDDYVAMVMLNLRKRMNPPLPPQCIGNVFQGTHVMPLSNESEIRFNDLAQKIRDSVRNTNDENVRMFYAAGGMLNFAKVACAEKEKSKGRESIPGIIVAFSSWCNSPFYEADFGWGKPTWVATALNQNRAAVFLDARDDGIEVWLGLEPEVMSKFEQNPDIIEFASFLPTN